MIDLKTNIKANHVSNLTDARYFAAWGTELMGFCLDTSSPNYINPTQINAIKGWLDGVKFIGEFGGQTVEDILQAAKLLNLEAVQVGFFTTVEQVEVLAKNVAVYKEVVVCPTDKDTIDIIKAFAPHVEGLILDFTKNNISWSELETVLDVEALKTLCQSNKIFLHFETTSTEVLTILDAIKPYGLCVAGGEEEKVGLKSFEELDDIFEILEA